MSKVKKAEYDLGKNEIEAHLKSQILAVCRGFCLRTWTKALNVAGVDPFSELRNLEKVFYPSASLCFILLCHNCPCSAYPGRRPTFQTKRGGHNNLRYSKKDSCSRQCPLLVWSCYLWITNSCCRAIHRGSREGERNRRPKSKVDDRLRFSLVVFFCTFFLVRMFVGAAPY